MIKLDETMSSTVKHFLIFIGSFQGFSCVAIVFFVIYIAIQLNRKNKKVR